MEDTDIFSIDGDTYLDPHDIQVEDNPFDFFMKQDDDNLNYQEILSDMELENILVNSTTEISSTQGGTTCTSVSSDQFKMTNQNLKSQYQKLVDQAKPNVSEVSKIRQKVITKEGKLPKAYIPLEDGGRTYVYEENPKEYMKARK